MERAGSGEVSLPELEEEATPTITFVEVDGLAAPRVEELLVQSGKVAQF